MNEMNANSSCAAKVIEPSITIVRFDQKFDLN